MSLGKAYANRRKKNDRPVGDFYSTPKSLVWVAREIIEREFSKSEPVFEPCYGKGAISQELKTYGFDIIENDLFQGGKDYLLEPYNYTQIITNPPFSLWDDFVQKAKLEANTVMMIGRLNYLGTASRFTNKIWGNLKSIYCFDRYVDYRTPYRDDGCFHVGAMATGWFVWEKGYSYKPTIETLDVQQYATLGNY